MAMTEARRNEIAYLYLKCKVQNDGVRSLVPNNIKRQIGNTAKDLGITTEEAQEFTHNLILPLFFEAFPMPKSQRSPFRV